MQQCDTIIKLFLFYSTQEKPLEKHINVLVEIKIKIDIETNKKKRILMHLETNVEIN